MCVCFRKWRRCSQCKHGVTEGLNAVVWDASANIRRLKVTAKRKVLLWRSTNPRFIVARGQWSLWLSVSLVTVTACCRQILSVVSFCLQMHSVTAHFANLLRRRLNCYRCQLAWPYRFCFPVCVFVRRCRFALCIALRRVVSQRALSRQSCFVLVRQLE